MNRTMVDAVTKKKKIVALSFYTNKFIVTKYLHFE